MRRRGFFRLLAALPALTVGVASARPAAPVFSVAGGGLDGDFTISALSALRPNGAGWPRDSNVDFESALRAAQEGRSAGAIEAAEALLAHSRAVYAGGLNAPDISRDSALRSASCEQPGGSVLSASVVNGSATVPLGIAISRAATATSSAASLDASVGTGPRCGDTIETSDIPSSIGGVAIPMVAGGCGDRNDHLARPGLPPTRPNPDASGDGCKGGRIGVGAPILLSARPLLPDPAPHAGIMGERA